MQSCKTRGLRGLPAEREARGLQGLPAGRAARGLRGLPAGRAKEHTGVCRCAWPTGNPQDERRVAYGCYPQGARGEYPPGCRRAWQAVIFRKARCAWPAGVIRRARVRVNGEPDAMTPKWPQPLPTTTEGQIGPRLGG